MHFAPPARYIPRSGYNHSFLSPPDALDPSAFSHVSPEAPQLLISQGGSKAPSLSQAHAAFAPGEIRSSRALALAKRDLTSHVGVRAPTVREQNLAKLYDVFHLCILRRDAVRAARALKVLLKAHEFPPDLFLNQTLQVCGMLAVHARIQEEEALAEFGWEVKQAAGQSRVEFLRALWLRAMPLRTRILSELVQELCAIGEYEEAQAELERLLYKYPYRENAILHFYAGILTLILVRRSDFAPPLSQEGAALAKLPVDRDQEGGLAPAMEDDAAEASQSGVSLKKSRGGGAADVNVSVARRRGVALGTSVLHVRFLPMSALATAKRHFQACLARAQPGKRSDADASDREEDEGAGAGAGSQGISKMEQDKTAGGGRVGYFTDERLAQRAERKIKEREKIRSTAVKQVTRTLGLPIMDGNAGDGAQKKASRAQQDTQMQDASELEDITVDTYIPGLSGQKRRRASSVELSSDEEEDESQISRRGQRSMGEHEREEQLIAQQRRMLKASGIGPLPSEIREEEEARKAADQEAMFDDDEDDQDDVGGGPTGKKNKGKIQSTFLARQGAWTIEIAQIYIDLISKEEATRGSSAIPSTVPSSAYH